MKKLFVLFLFIGLLSSCKKEEMVSPSESTESSSTLLDEKTLPTKADTKAVVSLVESEVSPKFGKPNATYYYFKVTDVTGTLGISVKLYEKATGVTTYLPMTKIGTAWSLSTKLTTNGWYDYRYVYTLGKNNISSSAYTLCNTRNVFSSTGTSNISWPFGADGSSWNYRKTWNGGEEGGSGYGWNEATHTGTTEKYSDDWNKTNDNGANICSPLDGYIEAISSYYVSGYGYSKYVSVIQQGPDGKPYRFYVAHLQNAASGLYVGKYVRAGIDQIGILGSTGASSPHAHTNMRVNNVSVPFYFNAQ